MSADFTQFSMSQDRRTFKGRSSSTSSNSGSKASTKTTLPNPDIDRVSISQVEFENQVKNAICPDCRKRCKDNDKAIECEFFERWFLIERHFSQESRGQSTGERRLHIHQHDHHPDIAPNRWDSNETFGVPGSTP